MSLRPATLSVVVSVVLVACSGVGPARWSVERWASPNPGSVNAYWMHSDHVGGLGVLHEKFPDTPIYASEATDKWMRDDPLKFYSLARKADPDYPLTLTYPTETFASNAELHIAGLTLQTADFGPGESATATVYFEPSSRALFGRDLTGNHVTPALIKGNSCGWLTDLAALSDLRRRRHHQSRAWRPRLGRPADQRAA
jgi:glyoxylase-like metal-dependent hydrolase (beta-lactamase superfamily II)